MEMAPNKAVSASCIIIAILMKRKKRRRVKKRACWVKKWISRRASLGAYQTLLRELQEEDPFSYRNFLRMDHNTFQELLELVRPFIQRQDTVMRSAIPPGERLALTLRYLATGMSNSKKKFFSLVLQACHDF